MRQSEQYVLLQEINHSVLVLEQFYVLFCFFKEMSCKSGKGVLEHYSLFYPYEAMLMIQRLDLKWFHASKRTRNNSQLDIEFVTETN